MNIPSKATLRKYGLTGEDWMGIFSRQDGACPVCMREFSNTVRPCIDHEHVKGFKKMKPERRKTYVRGLLCIYCNRRLVAKGMTKDKAYNIWIYLKTYEYRRGYAEYK